MSIASWLRLCGCCKLHGARVYGARRYAVQAVSETTYAEYLNNRGILRISGPEVSEFLQGLITNDMRHFNEGAQSMYAMFLNIKGRVLCDTIIYKTDHNNTFFIECDVNYLHVLQKHLKLFRVRKKMDIDSMDNMLQVWVLYKPDVALNTQFTSGSQKSVTEAISSETVNKHFFESNVIACRDPRLPALGVRVICPTKCGTTHSHTDQMPIEDKISYRMLRYRLGVGEGTDDLPPEKCFPLEVNCDYLHGVSFHKGCYIGQELTARTHHTGVVRKRLMPLIFDLIPKNDFAPDMPILSASSHKVVGKLRGAEKNTGLGILRITEVLQCQMLQISDGTCHTYKPLWWPQISPKDRVSVIK